MANYPGLSPHHFMPCGTWQANPWDTNPPLGTTPNIVWPQNQNPFQHQGGAPPWPHYNQQSLLPPYMPPHGLPGNHICHQPTYPSTGTNTDHNRQTTINNKNNSNLNRSTNNMVTCPCCGNVTTQRNIERAYGGNLSTTSSKTGLFSTRDDTGSSNSFLYTEYEDSSTDDTTKYSSSTTKATANDNQSAQRKDAENEAYMQHPYMIYYMNQMRAYQEALRTMMNQQNPTNQALAHQTNHTKKVLQDRDTAQGVNDVDNNNNGGWQATAGGQSGLHDVYQQSLEQMRNVQAMMQQAYQYTQSAVPASKEDQQTYSASSVPSKKETYANSLSRYFN